MRNNSDKLKHYVGPLRVVKRSRNFVVAPLDQLKQIEITRVIRGCIVRDNSSDLIDYPFTKALQGHRLQLTAGFPISLW